MSSRGDNAPTNPPRPEPGQYPKGEAPTLVVGTRRQVGSKPRRMKGGRPAVVLVGVTSHHRPRERRGQGEGPERGGVSEANYPNVNMGEWTYGCR